MCCPLKTQARLEEQMANIMPRSADGRFHHYNFRKERRSFALPNAEKSAPGFARVTDYKH